MLFYVNFLQIIKYLTIFKYVRFAYSKGHVLLAEPALTGDVSFSRAVILIAAHNPKGSVGFILNKPLTYTLDELIEDINHPFPVFNGGPVEQDNIYFIHTAPEVISGSIEISNGIYWGGDFNALLEALEQELVSENQIKFFWDIPVGLKNNWMEK